MFKNSCLLSILMNDGEYAGDYLNSKTDNYLEKRSIGVSFTEKASYSIELKKLDGRLLLAGFSYRSLNSNNEDESPSTIRGNNIRAIISRAKKEHISTMFCIPENHIFAKRIELKYPALEKYSHQPSWILKQHFRGIKTKLFLGIYKISEDSQRGTLYSAVAYPNSIIEAFRLCGVDYGGVFPIIAESIAFYKALDFSLNLRTDAPLLFLKTNGNIFPFVFIKNGIFADCGVFRLGNGAEALEELLIDIKTKLYYLFGDGSRFDKCSILIGGEVEEHSPLLNRIKTEITPKTNLFRPIDGLEISDRKYRRDDLLNNQHHYISAFGAALYGLDNFADGKSDR